MSTIAGVPAQSLVRRLRQKSPLSRVYAIGDIHGRADLFMDLLGLIEQDAHGRDPRLNRLVILGDFIDRGPESAVLFRALKALDREPNVIVLKGNHEAAMSDALDGNHQALDLWLAHGGLATLRSFGIDTEALDPDDTHHVLRLARQHIRRGEREWLRRLPTSAHWGRYHFVHAGVMPGVPLDQQADEHRLWITETFTSSTADHGAIVVHGHTIYEDGVHVAPNRIGVDTGAYRSGRLSAVGLEEDACWVVATDPNAG